MSVDVVARGLALRALTAAKAATSVVTPVLSSPDLLGNLTFWLDAQQPMYTASYAAAVSTLGQAIALIPDNSGSGNGAQIAAGTPTYNPTAINGHPAIDFNGTVRLSVVNLMTAGYAGAVTMYVVAKTKAALSAEALLLSTTTPNFWMGVQVGNVVDVTAAGVTGLPSGATLDTPDGIYGVSISATVLRFCENRNFKGLSGSQTVSDTTISGTTAWTGQTLTIGGLTGSGSLAWPGYIGEVLVYNAAHTAEQQRQVNDYLAAKWQTNTKPLIVTGGNSLTSGTNSTGGPSQTLSASGTNYPSRLFSAYAGAVDVRTDAYPGRTTAQMITETPSFSDKMFFPSTGAKQVLVAWELTNTLGITQSRAAAYRQYVQYCQARRAVGWRVIAVTGLNRLDAVYAGFAADMTAINTQIRANWPTFADGFADVALRSELSDPNNTTYFGADKVHLTDAGYVVVATVVKTACDPLVL